MHCTICGDPRPAVLAYNRRAWSAAAVEDFERWGSKDHDLDQKSSWARSKKIATICHYAEICAIWPLIPGAMPDLFSLQHLLDRFRDTNVLILKDTPLNGGRKSCRDVSWSGWIRIQNLVLLCLFLECSSPLVTLFVSWFASTVAS